MNICQKKLITPTFIISSGRSGTTLLRGILNASHQIFIPHESDFLARAYPFYGSRDDISKDDHVRLVNFFIKSSQGSGWGMSREYLLSELAQENPKTFAEVNSTFYRAYLKQEGLGHLAWGIKHPVLIASIDRILQVYPDAKIIHIVRDGRDVCVSYCKIHQSSGVKFGPNSSLTSSLYWIDGLRRVEEYKTDNVYELRYEDLIDNPKEVSINLCKFLGLDYHEQMHEQYQSSKVNKNLVLKEHQTTIHRNLSSKIDAKNQQKYLSQMKKSDRMLFELISAPYLEKYKYPTEFSVLRSPVLAPIRTSLYVFARLFNQWRYAKRDKKFYASSTSDC